MCRIPALRHRSRRIQWFPRTIVGSLSVCTPVPFVRAGIRIEHHDALVRVAVGDVDLVRRRIDRHRRRLAEKFRVVAAVGLPQLADLQQELPLTGELDHHVAVAGDPHIALVIDEHPVFGPGLSLRPVVAWTRSAPCLNDVALRIELDDGRGQTLPFFRKQFADDRAFVIGGMEYPRVISSIHRNPPCFAESPVVGKRLRPRRVELERGYLIDRAGLDDIPAHEAENTENDQDAERDPAVLMTSHV